MTKARRDAQYLEALINADTALYLLWKHTEINSEMMRALDHFQVDFVQAEIHKIEATK